MSSWGFNQIIPAHLEAPIKAGPREFREAFGFLQKKGAPGGAGAAGGAPKAGLALGLPAFPFLAAFGAPANEARTADGLQLVTTTTRTMRHPLRDGSSGHLRRLSSPPRAATKVSPFGEKDTSLLRGINSFLLLTGTIRED